jgi:dimethylglycine dehydrogenase
VVLVERDELTSGSTWHAAAQVTQFGAIQTMVGLKRHSCRLYAELAADPEFPITYHITGGIRLAHTQDHIDGYNHFIGMAKGMGVDFELLSPEDCGRRHALMRTQGLMGGLWDPLDGDIDPSQLTQALARGARNNGAEIYRFNPVEAIERRPGGEWRVHTRNGDITCEAVVNATGYRVNEVGAMLGVEHPVMSMEHMYFLTEPIAALEAMDRRVPILRDPVDDFYSRQEKFGLLVGIYEQGCKTWGMDGIDPDFTMELLPNDLDRCLDNMERVFERLPALTETGIHTVVNGPITYSADGLPLIGKIPGLENAYACLGLRAGIGEGGGHGKLLAEIIVHGEAEWDTWALDPRRFTSHCTVEYTALKAVEDYRNEFRFHMPHEHRPAGRPAKTTPLYAVLEERGAEFGPVAGWERALYYKPAPDFEAPPSFRFAAWHDVVAGEVGAVHERVGVMEVGGFTRFEISGPKAAAWLDGLVCGRVPQEVGKVGLTYFLTGRGHVLGEATLAKLAEDRFWFGSAAAAEYHDWDWLTERLPETGVALGNLTSSHTILVVAGPSSRDLLSKVSGADWSKDGFPWLGVRPVRLGFAPALAMSVSFSGELAWELHVPNEHLALVHQIIEAAGRDLGLRHFGLYAAESMRLEKGYRHWKADLITECSPYESSLDRFVRLDKGDFVGREALLRLAEQGPRRKFVPMIVDCDIASAQGGDPVYSGERLIGTVTSAGYGHRVAKNIALGFLDSAHAAPGGAVEIAIIGTRYKAEVVDAPIFDPTNQRSRS